MRVTHPPRDERGQALSAFVSVVVVALLLMAGLVVDGGAKAAAARSANYAAAEAARAAVDAGTTARLSGRPSAEIVRLAGERALADRGVAGSVHVAAGRVSVTTEVSTRTVFLTLIGIGELTASGRAEAELHRS